MLFPTIKHIDDVLPHIEGCDDFIVAERDGYTIINYMLESGDTFPPLGTETAAIRRECRGIIFDSSGKIIRRPLHKFFNIGQREECMPDKIDLTRPHIIMTKEDGSLIAPFLVGGQIIWGTKMAAQDFHEAVDAFVGDNQKFRDEVRYMLLTGRTPMYEWIGPDNQIVLKYENPELRLIAIRNMIDGSYYNMKHDLVTDIHNPTTYWKPRTENASDLVESVRPLTGIEGFVIRFDNGEMFKIKTDEYVLMHRAKEKILFDRHVIEMYYENLLDDVLPYLTDKERDSINEFVEDFTDVVKELRLNVLEQKNVFDDLFWTKRDFAVNYNPTSPYRPLFFSLYDGKDIDDIIRNLIEKNLGSNVNFVAFCDKYLNGVKRAA